MKILYSAPSLHIRNEWCELIGRRLAIMHKTFSYDYRRMPMNANEDLKRMALREKPDLFFAIKGELIAPETVMFIKAQGAKCVLFDNDDFQAWKPGLYKEFDTVFTPCMDLLPKYDKLGVAARWLFYPYSPRIHRKLGIPKKYDMVYVGTYYPERAEIVKAFHDIGMPVFGNGWEKAGIQTQRINALEMVRLYNESKIVLNLHQEEMKKHKVGFNLRISEALGCSAFVLTDHCPGMEEFFKDGEHLVEFDPTDIQDLFRKVRIYTSQDELREKIAQAGHERVEQFSIDNLLHEVLTD